MERHGRFFGAPGIPRPRRSRQQRRRVLEAAGRNSALQITPGEVAGQKGPLEVLEVGGAAGQLKTDLFRPAIQKHHRTRILFAIEDVGNDHEKGFLTSDFDRIHLLGNECDIGAIARNATECFLRQLLSTLLIEYRRLAKDDLCDRPCGLSFLLRI